MEEDPQLPHLARLVAVMRELLGPEGCPWDREQTLESLRPYLVEECFEVLEAIDRGDPVGHCEELGDLLFQIVFQSEIQRSAGHFDLDAVARSIADKLVRRHPHVFARGQDSPGWEAIKEQERAAKGLPRRTTLGGIPVGLPALSRAQALSTRAARVGFDWNDADGCARKVEEELAEVRAAQTEQELFHEIGDLLFAAVCLARKHDVDAQSALRAANRKFERRFRQVEDRLAAAGKTPEESNLTEMDDIWEQIKAEERNLPDR